jgi:plastocyanin
LLGKIRIGVKGSYTYHCVFHPFMHGTIVVK